MQKNRQKIYKKIAEKNQVPKQDLKKHEFEKFYESFPTTESIRVKVDGRRKMVRIPARIIVQKALEKRLMNKPIKIPIELIQKTVKFK